MKIVFTLSLVFTLFIAIQSTSNAQVQQRTTEHITFNEDIESLHFRLPKKDVEIKTTKGSRILIEAQITLSIGEVKLLDFLVKSGRYNFSIKQDNIQESIEITNVAPSNGVLIKQGKEIQETIKHTIYVPVSQVNKVHIGLTDLSMMSALD
ncbi:MAG: hypothetical protein GY810_17515 [Aureispira sp.]|nr:hypothetical protein [Aureispira sp.]